MSYQWHSQRQVFLDAIRLTWIAIGTRKKEVEKKKKNTKKQRKTYKCNYGFNLVTIREKKTTYTSVTFSTRFTLISYETLISSELHK